MSNGPPATNSYKTSRLETEATLAQNHKYHNNMSNRGKKTTMNKSNHYHLSSDKHELQIRQTQKQFQQQSNSEVSAFVKTNGNKTQQFQRDSNIINWQNVNFVKQQQPRSRKYDTSTTSAPSATSTTRKKNDIYDSNICTNNFGTGIPQLDDQLLAAYIASTTEEQEAEQHEGGGKHTNNTRYHGSNIFTNNNLILQHKNSSSKAKHQLKQAAPATMTVIIHRVNLVDGWKSPCDYADDDDNKQEQQQLKQHNAAFILPRDAVLVSDVNIAPCSFSKPITSAEQNNNNIDGDDDDFFDSFGGGNNHHKKPATTTIAIVYAPVASSSFEQQQHQKGIIQNTATSTSINNTATTESNNTTQSTTNSSITCTPFTESEQQYAKYWAQRKRFFSRFDEGIQLGDAQGWYSVTPEAIADHVARRMGEKAALNSESKPMIVLDAFCGCGGNAIAFGKLSVFSVSLVVCCDISVDKLRNAANNASVYGIPHDKIIFIQCDSLYIMSKCYVEGTLVVLPQEQEEEESHFREEVHGYTIGNNLHDLLPSHIDAIFMDPPWGGIHYGAAGGKNGYDLSKNMKILSQQHCHDNSNLENNEKDAAGANGFDLVAMAAMATKSKFVMYDIPRNTNKLSIARAALAAGYKGNIKLEEYYLNGRLKTATAFLGWDYHSS